MANAEMQLVSRVLRKGQLNDIIEWGITLDDCLTDEPRHIMSSLLALRASTNGGQLGEQLAREMFPTFQPCDDDITPLEVLCMEVRKNRIRAEVRGITAEMLEVVDRDPLEALQRADTRFKNLIEIGYTSKQTDVRFRDSLDRSISRMELLEQGVVLSVANWPWAPLDAVTGGVQKDDYIVYYGRPKSFKTWMLAYHIAHTYDQGKRLLIYTKEMTADNIFMRVAACLSALPYQEFRMGKLELHDRQRLYELQAMVRDMKSSDDMICLSGRDAPNGKDTVEWLESKVVKYGVDMTFVDGMYLMSTSGSQKDKKDNFRVQEISRGLRQMVLNTGRPIACTIQANRSAAKNQTAELDEIAFSDAIGMDATVIMRSINDKTTPTCTLVMGGSREFSLPGIRTWAIPATNFSFKEELGDKDIHKAKVSDKEVNGKSDTRVASQEAERRTQEAVHRHVRMI